MRACAMSVIAHISDIHFGANDARLTELLLADLTSIAPDLVVVSGDLTQRATRQQFVSARAFLDQIDAPVLVIAGNHDISLVDLPRRLLSPSRRFEELIGPDRDPVARLPGIVAVGLDSMPRWRWKAGHVSERQASIVTETFNGCAPETWRLVVTHHPVLPAHLSSLFGRSDLVRACEAGHVDLLLSGHTHTPRTDIVSLGDAPTARTALAIGAGTAISHRTREAANAYNVIELANDKKEGASISVSVRSPTPSGWTDLSTAHFVVAAAGIAAASSS